MPKPTDIKFFHSGMSGAPQITAAAGTLLAVLDWCLVNGSTALTLDSLVVDGAGIATATRAAGHAAVVHSVIEIAGATPAGLNGEHKIVSASGTTFTFEVDPSLAGTATGVITAKLAPAGWEKVFSGTNKAAYRSLDPASTMCLLRVDDTNTQYAQVRGYETMSDIDTGTGMFPLVAQASSPSWLKHFTAGTMKDWFVVADSRMMYVGIAHYGSFGVFQVGAFGDFLSMKAADAYGCVMRPHMQTASPSSASDSYSVFYTGTSVMAYAARSFAAVGAAVGMETTGSYPLGTIAPGGSNGAPFPNPADWGVYMSPVMLVEDANQSFRGEYPGVYSIMHAATNQLTVPGAAGFTTIDDVADLPGRSLLIIPCAVSTNGNFYPNFIDVTGPWR